MTNEERQLRAQVAMVETISAVILGMILSGFDKATADRIHQNIRAACQQFDYSAIDPGLEAGETAKFSFLVTSMVEQLVDKAAQTADRMRGSVWPKKTPPKGR